MPSLNINTGGTWVVPESVHVRKNSAWHNTTKVWVKQGGVWQAIWEFITTLNITSNQTDLNLRDYALANGWGGTSPLIVNIAPNVYVYGTGATAYALLVSGSFAGGLTLNNAGRIVGKSGNGGAGGLANGASHPGYTGGWGYVGLSANAPVTVNNTGYIAGGGGGGGGGGGASIDYISTTTNAGGGGGGGASTGIGTTSGGAGGVGYNVNGAAGGGGQGDPNGAFGQGGAGGYSNYTGVQVRGGAGGSGNWIGASGIAGTGGRWVNGEVSNGGPGGVAGAAVLGNSNITWANTGTRYGVIQS